LAGGDASEGEEVGEVSRIYFSDLSLLGEVALAPRFERSDICDIDVVAGTHVHVSSSK
jgi:hypothetical protein